MTLLRLLLGASLAAFGLVAIAPVGPASACSCAMVPVADRVAVGDPIFRGTVTDVGTSVGGTTTYTFRVDEVFQGTAARTTPVRSRNVCGFESVEEGDDLLVLTYRVKGQEALYSGLCSGTRGASPAALREIEAVTGPGRPPAATTAPAPSTAPITASAGPAGRALPFWGIAAIAGGAVMLLGLVTGLRRARAR
jgi:hypothetical protein